MNWRQLAPHLSAERDIMIMTHDKPDGDAWGCTLGFGLVLEGLGYKPRFVHAGLKPSRMYSWLPGQHLISRIPKESLAIPQNGLVIVLDCGDLSRCEFSLAPEQVLLNVDHHVSNPGYGGINWIDASAGATAQVVCRGLLEEGLPIPPEAATCFYIALASDT